MHTSILLHTTFTAYSKSTSVNASCIKGKIDQERMRKVIQRINREKAASAFVYDIATFQETWKNRGGNAVKRISVQYRCKNVTRLKYMAPF